MKSTVVSLIARNAIVAMLFLVLLSGLRAFTSGFPLMSLIVPVAFFGGLFWANAKLFRQGHRIIGTLICVGLFPALGFAIAVGSIVVGRTLTEWEYQSAGLKLVTGCNLAAASRADIELYMLKDRLKEMTSSPAFSPDKVALIRNALPIAEERVEVLGTDCSRRGHRDDHLYKTNWIAIKTALDATEE